MKKNTIEIIQSESIYLHRQERLKSSMNLAGLGILAINPGPSLVYLTGLHFHLMERPVVALFSTDKPPILALPELETAKLEDLPYEIQSFAYGEDPAKWVDSFHRALQACGDVGTIGVEPTKLRFLEIKLMEEAAPGIKLISAEELLAEMRMRKDDDELTAMRNAVYIAEQSLQAVLPMIKAGVTERQIASELTLQLLRQGADSDLSFSPIVSGGPNSANPHASPSDRPLQIGDLLVIDWGALYQGYTSDLTRTFAVGKVEAEFNHIASIVKEANAAGRAAIRPGAQAGEIDLAARSVIEKAGYGNYFFHRTGHGLGMEGHEAPYMRAGNPMLLEPGMTFTVEPGIYLLERSGVRIEDNVVVTESGSETLSTLPRELISLGG